MKTLEVKQPYADIYVMNEDGEFRCEHENAELDPPCCTTRGSSGYIECGCGGMYAVYCPDCHNEDLQDHEVDNLIEALIGEPDYE